MSFLEGVGWLGTAVYIAAYGLLALRMLPAQGLYFGLNVLAATGVALVSWSTGTWQAVMINVSWATISVYGLLGASPPVRAVSPGLARASVAIPLAAGCMALGLGWWRLGSALWGWASVLAFLLGYALFVADRIAQREFHGWNFVAAASLLPVLWLDGNAPVFALETAWALAALVGLWRSGDARAVPS